MAEFLKGIVAGIGGVAPGLSGSVLLVIFGLYHRVVEAVGTFFSDPKKNIAFLAKLGSGVVLGVLLFSKVVDFLLTDFEFATRYAFLGLIVGTIPLFWGEVRKKGYAPKFALISAASFCAGVWLVYLNGGIPAVTDPNVLQSMLMGLAYAGSSIIPGVDSAAIMSALGLYVLWVQSLATLNFSVLIPAALGLGVGLLLFSAVMNGLIKRFYTGTFSVVFGLFLSIIPSVLKGQEGAYLVPGDAGEWALAVVIAAVGFAAAYFMGKIEESQEKAAEAEADAE